MSSYMDQSYLDGVAELNQQLAGSGVSPQQLVEMGASGGMTDAGDSVIIAGYRVKKQTLILVVLAVIAGLLWVYYNKKQESSHRRVR